MTAHHYTETQIEDAVIEVLDRIATNGIEIGYSESPTASMSSPLDVSGQVLKALRAEKDAE